jgi:peptidoglycan hydrolase CwlO-like protein
MENMELEGKFEVLSSQIGEIEGRFDETDRMLETIDQGIEGLKSEIFDLRNLLKKQ